MTEKLVHGIWPALCTAFDDSGDSVDGERQRNLVGRLIDSGIQGFFVCGGTGEGMAMSLPERMKVAEVVAHEAAGAVRHRGCARPDPPRSKNRYLNAPSVRFLQIRLFQ